MALKDFFFFSPPFLLYILARWNQNLSQMNHILGPNKSKELPSTAEP